MGKKKKKKKKSKFFKKIEEAEEKEEKSEIDWDFTCEHPLYVKVARDKVAVISYHDFDYDVHRHTIANLDVFIALTDIGFNKYEKFKSSYSNSLLQKLAERFKRYTPTLDNLIVLEVTDGSVDAEVFEIAKDLITEGKKIGFGCMAGHGRTGWLLAKLIKHFESTTGDEAVRRARKRLCKKCVETGKQIVSLGCVSELGWYEKKKMFEAKDKWNSWKGDKPYYSADSYYKNWLKKQAKEILGGKDEVIIKDEETEKDTPPLPSEDISQELIEAWRKSNVGEKLTEEEERLIMEDTARYG